MSTISSVSAVPYPQSTQSPAPASDVAVDVAEPTAAKGIARGLTLLASDTAATVLTEQSAAQPEPTSAATAKPATSGLDLHGQDLRKVDLTKLDLRSANLSDVDLSGVDLSGLDLNGATLTNAKLDGANLTDTRLDGAKAQGASFNGATLVRTSMDAADMSGAKFKGAYIAGLEQGLSMDRNEQASAGKIFNFKGTNFTGADFSDATLQSGRFKEVNLDRANFSGSKGEFAILDSTSKNSSFRGFSGVLMLTRGDVSGGDFSGISGATVAIGSAKVDNVTFSDSKIQLTMSDADIRSVNFSVKNKDLISAGFINVNMQGMDFSGYNLSRAVFQTDSTHPMNNVKSLSDNFKGTNFSGAVLERASFFGTNLNEAKFEGADLTNSYYYGGAKIDMVKSIVAALASGKAMYDAQKADAALDGRSSAPDKSLSYLANAAAANSKGTANQDWLISMMQLGSSQVT